MSPERLETENKSRPVLLYVGVMFGVAMLLLVLSFLMQQRNHEDLMQSMSGVQSVVDLELEIDDLNDQLATASAKLEEAEAALEEAKLAAEKLEAEKLALYGLMEIRSAYETAGFTAAKTLYDSFPHLEEILTYEPLSNIDYLASPLWTYENIKKVLDPATP